MVSTLAGSSVAGSHDGTGAAAQFDNPTGVALDPSGNLYVPEYDGSRVRRVTPAGTSSLVTAQPNLVGPFGVVLVSPTQLIVQTDFNDAGVKTDSSGTLWRIDLPGGAATQLVRGLGRPRGLAVRSPGTIAVADRLLQTVSLLGSASGQMTPLAGSPGHAGFADGRGAAALFHNPLGVTVMPDGAILIADSDNHAIRKVIADGTVTTFAGDGNAGMIDGPAPGARFDRPIALAADGAGNVYVSDQGGNHRLRRITPAGMVETVAGDGSPGFRDGPGATAEFFGQEGLALAPDGKILYATDGNSGDGTPFHRIRVVALP
jgi:DNA-binding beta-propeller fold protein YncE